MKYYTNKSLLDKVLAAQRARKSNYIHFGAILSQNHSYSRFGGKKHSLWTAKFLGGPKRHQGTQMDSLNWYYGILGVTTSYGPVLLVRGKTFMAYRQHVRSPRMLKQPSICDNHNSNYTLLSSSLKLDETTMKIPKWETLSESLVRDNHTHAKINVSSTLISFRNLSSI